MSVQYDTQGKFVLEDFGDKLASIRRLDGYIVAKENSWVAFEFSGPKSDASTVDVMVSAEAALR